MTYQNKIKAPLGIFILMLLPIISWAQQFQFKGELSSPIVGLEDYVEVNYILEQVPGLQNFEGPNFAGFQVLNQTQGSSVHESIINGKREVIRYIITSYVLKPKKVGHFTIPPAKVKYNDKSVSSNTLKLEVVKQAPRRQPVDPIDAFFGRQPAAPKQRNEPSNDQVQEFSEKNLSKNIFIRVEVDNKNPYKGEQVNTSYKLYTRLPMNMSISQLPSLNGFWSEDYTLPKVPKPTTEIVNGMEYQVFLLKKTALFPQEVGSLTLDPAKAEGTVRIMEQKKVAHHPLKDDPFFSYFMDDPFFNDAFFSDVNYRDVPVSIKSEPLQIQVKDLPSSSPANFTGGIGKFTVATVLPAKKYTTNDAIEYNIIIEGEGNTKFIGVPKVQWPENLGMSEPTVKDTIIARTPTIISRKVLSYLVNPTDSGAITIPSIGISYFNPVSKTYETLQTDAQVIKVDQGVTASNDVEEFSQLAPSNANSNSWYVFIVVLILVFIVVVGVLRKRKKNVPKLPVQETQKNIDIANKRLALAQSLINNGNDGFYEELNKALWLYIAQKKQIAIGDLNKNLMMEGLKKEVSELLVVQINQITKECELALYSPMNSVESKEELLQKTKSVIIELEEKL